jgi:hypothetical protein
LGFGEDGGFDKRRFASRRCGDFDGGRELGLELLGLGKLVAGLLVGEFSGRVLGGAAFGSGWHWKWQWGG